MGMLAELFGGCADHEDPEDMQEDSMTEDDEDDENSDDDDIFEMKAAPEVRLLPEYKDMWLYRWQLACAELSTHLRDDVLLPYAPQVAQKKTLWTDVKQGIVLPPWHCAFQGCHAMPSDLPTCEKHEYNLWQHIWTSGTHQPLLRQVIAKYHLRRACAGYEETAFTLYSRSLLEKERECCPRLGLATDRRTLGYVGEVFHEENVKVLICFICGCKHLFHEGVNKFGRPSLKGTIAIRRHRSALQQLLTGADTDVWRYNLCAKFYKDRFGQATAAAPDLQDGCMEWRRKVRCSETTEEVLCCQEDVTRTRFCKHGDDYVCSRCDIPICNECYHFSTVEAKIPKALANDNVIGYVHRFLVEHNVTWLEATIAGPVFSGLVTYYVEGNESERHHMMETAVGKPERAWAIRGNLFSFLLPWEEIMAQLFKKIEDGDLSEWPLNRYAAAKVVTVRLVRGPEQILQKFRELHVRSWVVRRLSYIYIERHIADLADRPGVLKIHAHMQQATVEASLKAHVDQRVAEFYPPAEYNTGSGHVPPEITTMVREQQAAAGGRSVDSGFDMKQSTMPDISASDTTLFQNMRPCIVTDEAATADTLPAEVIAEHALKSISSLTIQMSNKFENQFVSKYTPRIFPWALNYDCGGAEYPNLFNDWEELLQGEQDRLAHSIQQRWRRIREEAPLLPGDYAAMLATRVETQVAGDWMVVPAARNLHWRYAVLHSAFIACKQKVAPGETLQQNLVELVEATKKIWQKMASNTVLVNGRKKNINGNVGLLFASDDLTSSERIILRSYLNTTASIAGCQQIRKKIGACCFGMRVVYGECIFITVSPNRRHSSMVLKLSRARCTDVGISGEDDVSVARRAFASAAKPSIFCQSTVTEDPEGREVTIQVPLPPLVTRQACNAQDPLASVHHSLAGVRGSSARSISSLRA